MLASDTSPATVSGESLPGYPAGHPLAPANYLACRSDLSWERARLELEGLSSGGLNIAHEAVDRHARGA